MKEVPSEGAMPAGKRPVQFLTVNVVPNHRMSDGGQVHANLMGAARVNVNIEQAEPSRTIPDRKLRQRLPSGLRTRRHTRSARRVTPDRQIDGSGIVTDLAVDSRTVRLLDLPPLETGGQRRVSSVGACDQNQARGPSIQAMDDSGTPPPGGTGQGSKTGHQCVRQRPARHSGPGMDDHPGRLFHDSERLVLVMHVEGNGLGMNNQVRGGRMIGKVDLDRIAGMQAMPVFFAPPVHQNGTAPVEGLKTRPRPPIEATRKKVVQSRTRVVRPDFELHPELRAAPAHPPRP